MKFNVKVFAVAALSAAVASVAMAGEGYAFGDSEVAVSFGSYAGSGLYVTGTTGSYAVEEFGEAYGNAFNSANYASGSPGAYEYAAGSSTAYAIAEPYGSFAQASYADQSTITFTNFSSYDQTLLLSVYTYGEGLAFSTDENSYAYGSGFAEIYDSTGTVVQESQGFAFVTPADFAGIGGGYYNYDTYNGGGSYSESFPQDYPSEYYFYGDDTEYYAVTFTPGMSDTFTMNASSNHTAYSSVPGPAAIAPFGLGVLGALRRRKRRV